MGQFSWKDCITNEQIIDDLPRDVYLLVPQEFGGGHIKEPCYDGYGNFGGHDVYELVYDWNRKFVSEVKKLADEGKWKGRVAWLDAPDKRDRGIALACHDEDNERLPYPIKITYEANAVYEECEPSPTDPNQGWPSDDFYSDYEMDGEVAWERFDNELLWNILKAHRGHKIEIACYGEWDNPASITLEDLDTNEIILDAGLYTLCARKDI